MNETRATSDTKLKVFISYSRKDLAFAGKLEAALKARGIDPLIDKTEIYAFEDWWARIQALIRQSDTVIFVLSPDAAASAVCQKEVAFAASLNKRFAPIVHKQLDVGSIPPQLSQLNFIFFDIEAEFDAGFERLSAALRTDIAWVRKHTTIGESAHRWTAAAQAAGMLLRSPALEDAEAWIASRPNGAPQPMPEALAYITASRRAATRRRNMLVGALSTGLLLATVLAGLAFWQSTIAAEQRNIAVKNEITAKEQRDGALKTQSLFLGDLADQHTRAGDSISAALIAAEALPDTSSADRRPYVAQSERSLWGALLSRRETAVISASMHGDPVLVVNADVNRTGTRIVSLDSWRTLRIYDAATLKLLTSRLDAAEFFLLSGNGGRLLSVSTTGLATLWDLDTANPLNEFNIAVDIFEPDYSGGKNQIALSESGDQLLFVGKGDRAQPLVRVELFDTRTGNPSKVVTVPGLKAVNVAFSSGNARVLVETDTHGVVVYDIASNAKLVELEGHTDTIWSASYSPDGKTIVTTSGHRDLSLVKDASARLWDAVSGQELKKLTSTIKGAVHSAAFSPNGEYLVTQSQDTLLWSLAKGDLVARLSQPGHSPDRIVFNRTSTALASVSGEGTVVVWSAAVGGAMITLRHLARATGAAFLPSGDRLMTWSEDQSLRLWSIESRLGVNGALRASGRGMMGNWYHLETAADGTAALIVAERRTTDLEVGTLDRGKGISPRSAATTKLPDSRFIGSPAFSTDGERVLVRDKGGPAILQAASGKIIASLPMNGGIVIGAAFGPDGSPLTVVKTAQDVRVTKVGASDVEVILRDAPFDAEFVKFSADAQRVAFVSGDTLHVYDATTGTRLLQQKAEAEPIASFGLSANGAHLVFVMRDSGKWGGLVRVVSLPSGRDLQKVEGNVIDAAISPDGRRFAVTFSNGETKVFDTDSGIELHVFRQRLLEPTTGVAFSPDGSSLVIGSAMGSIERWPVWPDPASAIDALRLVTHRCLTPDQRRQLFLSADLSKWCKHKWPYE